MAAPGNDKAVRIRAARQNEDYFRAKHGFSPVVGLGISGGLPGTIKERQQKTASTVAAYFLLLSSFIIPRI